MPMALLPLKPPPPRPAELVGCWALCSRPGHAAADSHKRGAGGSQSGGQTSWARAGPHSLRGSGVEPSHLSQLRGVPGGPGCGHIAAVSVSIFTWPLLPASSPFLSLVETLVTGLRACPEHSGDRILRPLIIVSKTLIANKVTLTGSGLQDADPAFWGADSPAHHRHTRLLETTHQVKPNSKPQTRA